VRAGRRIDLKSIRFAAREFFERDKAQNIDDGQRAALLWMVDTVLGKGQARTFLLEKRYEKDEIIRSLFDLRLLHLVYRGFYESDQPGQRYNIYTLDYGLYAHLLGTPRAPKQDFTDRFDPEDDTVAIDSRRAVRRIVLRPTELREAVTRMLDC
jgi:hypothetical protein